MEQKKITYKHGRIYEVAGVEYNFVKDIKHIDFEVVETLEWRNLKVLGFSNYEVNQFGQLRRIETKRMIAGDSTTGDLNDYVYFRLVNDEGVTKRVKAHKLVVHAFEIGTKEQREAHLQHRLEIDHIDRCRGNNYVGNLRLVTRKENAKNRVVTKSNVKTPASTVLRILEMHYIEGFSKNSISRFFNLSAKGVTDICYGRRHRKIYEDFMEQFEQLAS